MATDQITEITFIFLVENLIRTILTIGTKYVYI